MLLPCRLVLYRPSRKTRPLYSLPGAFATPRCPTRVEHVPVIDDSEAAMLDRVIDRLIDRVITDLPQPI